MKISDAIKHAEALVPSLKREEAVAVYVLVELAKKVIRVRRPMRDLADALAPQADLNQVAMFEEKSDESEG